MNVFTISQLQEYSGIKAHTIRIWEQRYNALQPHRTEGNTRYYDGDQLKRLLNITSLLSKKHKISELCSMTDEEHNQLIENYFLQNDEKSTSSELYISQLLSAALEFDESRFEKFFSNCLLRSGLKETYLEVLYPALVRVGIMWARDVLSPANEHFIVNLIRKKILAAIASMPPAKDTEDSWLLFLPEDEFHEIGLLMAYFLTSSRGKKVYYLGANVPLESLDITIEQIKPVHVLCFLVSHNNKIKVIDKLNELSKGDNQTKFYAAWHWKKADANNEEHLFQPISSLEELESIL